MSWFLKFRLRLLTRIGYAAAYLTPDLYTRSNLIDKPEFEKAFNAFDSGNLRGAFDIFLELAETGDAEAQNNVGVLYECCVPYRDDTQAEDWYRKAAEQGLAEAQFNLAAILVADLMKGFRAPIMKGFQAYTPGTFLSVEEKQDRFIEAYMWLLLADSQGHEPASNSLGPLEQHMTEEQLVQAKQMARDRSDTPHLKAEDAAGTIQKGHRSRVMRNSPAWKTAALTLVVIVLMWGSEAIADWLWGYWELDRVLPSLLFGVFWAVCFFVVIAIVVHVPGFDKTLGKL